MIILNTFFDFLLATMGFEVNVILKVGSIEEANKPTLSTQLAQCAQARRDESMFAIQSGMNFMNRLNRCFAS